MYDIDLPLKHPWNDTDWFSSSAGDYWHNKLSSTSSIPAGMSISFNFLQTRLNMLFIPMLPVKATAMLGMLSNAKNADQCWTILGHANATKITKLQKYAKGN